MKRQPRARCVAPANSRVRTKSAGTPESPLWNGPQRDVGTGCGAHSVSEKYTRQLIFHGRLGECISRMWMVGLSNTVALREKKFIVPLDLIR
jgi:hypothetical protein